MLNHYEILGISRTAGPTTIRSAFKRLALKYHPDRNPNNTAAEEYFKRINEAYQVLSNPERKKRYDFILNYSYQTTTPAPAYTSNRSTRERPPAQQRKTVYNRYGKTTWKNVPKYKKAAPYQIDKNYFKTQLITLSIVVLLGLIIVGSNNYYNYLQEIEKAEIKEQNSLVLQEAEDLYNQGHYRKAIEKIIDLSKRFPFQSEFYEQKQQMVAGLYNSALTEYNSAAYNNAIEHLEIVRDYERPMKLSTWRMLAESYYETGEFKKSVHAYDYIFIRDKYSIELAVTIGKIYEEKLEQPEKALEYYDEAELLFKQFQSSNYGNAFELLIDPSNLPDSYFDLFVKKAQLNMKLEKYDEAITDCNWAIFIRPTIAKTYHWRALCKLKTGNTTRACLDWKRAQKRGYLASTESINLYCQ